MKKLIFILIAAVPFTATCQIETPEIPISEMGGTITEGWADTLAETFQQNYCAEQEFPVYTFSISIVPIKELADTEGVEGLNVYLGQDPNTGELKLIFCAADEGFNNLGSPKDISFGSMYPKGGNYRPLQKPYGGHGN